MKSPAAQCATGLSLWELLGTDRLKVRVGLRVHADDFFLVFMDRDPASDGSFGALHVAVFRDSRGFVHREQHGVRDHVHFVPVGLYDQVAGHLLLGRHGRAKELHVVVDVLDLHDGAVDVAVVALMDLLALGFAREHALHAGAARQEAADRQYGHERIRRPQRRLPHTATPFPDWIN